MRDYSAISKRLRRYSENCVAYKLDADFADAVSDAADAIEELLDELTTIRKQLPHWISVGERLPEIDTSVLMCAFGKSVGEGTYRGYDGVHHVWKMYAVSGTYWDDEVTHWMPLPAPPKGVE